MSELYDALVEWSIRQPKKSAVISGDGTAITYAELKQQIDAVAEGLLPHLRNDDAPLVLLALDNPQTVILAFAINRLDRCLAPLNPSLGISQLQTMVAALRPQLLLHDEHSARKASSLASGALTCVNLADLAAGGSCTDRARERVGTSKVPSAYPPAMDSAPFLLTLSSGSTGNPKPVVFTDSGKLRRAQKTATEFTVTADDIILCASPFFHSLGQRLTFMPLILGATLVLLPRFSAGRWIESVRRHGVTFTICVSSHLVALLELLTDPTSDLGCIRALVSSSANIDLTTKQSLFEQHRFDFYEMYGASEVATASRLSPMHLPDKARSVGCTCNGVEVRIFDSERNDCGLNVMGEIAVRSELASPGYYARPDLDAKAYQDGWFLTGDLGYRDAEGFLYFADRLSDVIVTGGSNIFPSDVEAAIRDHKGVTDCLVVGVSDTYLGQAVVAVISTTLNDTHSLERSLRQQCRARLASPQQPLAWFFVDTLPLNAAGKIDRRAVREHHEALNLDLSARFRALAS